MSCVEFAVCGSGCIKFVFCFISLELHSEGSKLSGSSTVVPSPALNNPLAVKLLHVLVQRNKTECLLQQQKQQKRGRGKETELHAVMLVIAHLVISV